MRAQAEALEVSRATINDGCGLKTAMPKVLGTFADQKVRSDYVRTYVANPRSQPVVSRNPMRLRRSPIACRKRDASDTPTGAVELPRSEEMASGAVTMRMGEIGRRGGHAQKISLAAKHRARRKAARARWDHRATAPGAARKILLERRRRPVDDQSDPKSYDPHQSDDIVRLKC